MRDSYTVVGGTYQKLRSEGFQDHEALLDDYARRYIPAMFREARTSLGLTQAQVAERLGVNQSNYGRLEREGNTALSLALFIRVAKVLDLGVVMKFCSISEMVREIEKPLDFKDWD